MADFARIKLADESGEAVSGLNFSLSEYGRLLPRLGKFTFLEFVEFSHRLSEREHSLQRLRAEVASENLYALQPTRFDPVEGTYLRPVLPLADSPKLRYKGDWGEVEAS